MKKIGIIFVILVMIAGIMGWGILKGGWFTKKPIEAPETQQSAEKPEGGKEEEFIRRGIPIKAYKMAKTVFEDFLPALGTVKGNVEVKLSMETQGVVDQFNFREGDHIKKGDVIAQLTQKDAMLKIEYARTKYKTAMVNLSTQEKKLKMIEKLYDIGAINKLKLEEAKTETTAAFHQMEGTKVELETAEQEINKTRLLAMRDGILGTKDVEAGEVVTPYTKIATLVDTNSVNAEVGVVERDITRVKLGQIARVYVDAYPDTAFEGIVDHVLPVLGEKTRTLTMRVRIDNTRGMLMPGMFVRADIVLYEKAGVLSVPRVALKKIDERMMVYVVDEKTNTVEERLVRTGYISTDYAEVIAGLKEDELIAISNVEELVSGSPVQITEIQVREM